MLAEAGDWLVLAGVAGCGYLAWKGIVRTHRGVAFARVAAMASLVLSAVFFYA